MYLIKIKRKDISLTNNGIINYTNSSGRIFKRVYYFVVYPSKKINSIDFKPQFEEVDWVGFVNKEDAKKRIFGRFASLIDLLD